MKTRTMLSVLALAALAACGGDDEGQTSGGVDTTGTAAPVTTDTAVMAPPATAPMGTDTTGMTMDSAGMGTGAAGAGQSDTLIKVDSTTKM